MSNPSKDLRKQLRNELKSMVDELLTTEFVTAMEKRLRSEINDRLNVIDQRQKDIQGYIVRQSGLSVKTDV